MSSLLATTRYRCLRFRLRYLKSIQLTIIIIIIIIIIITIISNGNRAEWSPIQSVIIRVITKSADRAAGVRFVYHEYDYRLNWTTRSPIIN